MIANVFDLREKPDLKAYDHLVIGSAIQWGKVHPALQEYVRDVWQRQFGLITVG